MDNEPVRKFPDVDSKSGNGSKGSMNSSSVKMKRKRHCKSCKSRKLAKHRIQKDKTHEIANLDANNFWM